MVKNQNFPIYLFSKLDNDFVGASLEFRLGIGRLALDDLDDIGLWRTLPSEQTIYLVESDQEGRLSFLENVDGFDGLRFQAVHNIDDQDGDIAK